jgi:hypothetical protein
MASPRVEIIYYYCFFFNPVIINERLLPFQDGTDGEVTKL